jgi:hypothetical protein
MMFLTISEYCRKSSLLSTMIAEPVLSRSYDDVSNSVMILEEIKSIEYGEF